MSDELKIIIIAGPNGAGKTTFARQFLPNEARCPAFLNADLIAAGISPFDPDAVAVRAGRLMLEEIEVRVRAKKSFAIETTLSGRSYVPKIREWQKLGYQVKMFFLSIQTPDLDVARVAARVAQGGHNIPEATIRRRFDLGIEYFRTLYQPLVDAWMLYDNSGVVPLMMEWGEKSKNEQQPTDPDLIAADNALRRAAKAALSLANQTKTPCYILEDGEIVDTARAQQGVGETSGT